jgi:hypothetical protein
VTTRNFATPREWPAPAGGDPDPRAHPRTRWWTSLQGHQALLRRENANLAHRSVRVSLREQAIAFGRLALKGLALLP